MNRSLHTLTNRGALNKAQRIFYRGDSSRHDEAAQGMTEIATANKKVLGVEALGALGRDLTRFRANYTGNQQISKDAIACYVKAYTFQSSLGEKRQKYIDPAEEKNLAAVMDMIVQWRYISILVAQREILDFFKHVSDAAIDVFAKALADHPKECCESYSFAQLLEPSPGLLASVLLDRMYVQQTLNFINAVIPQLGNISEPEDARRTSQILRRIFEKLVRTGVEERVWAALKEYRDAVMSLKAADDDIQAVRLRSDHAEVLVYLTDLFRQDPEPLANMLADDLLTQGKHPEGNASLMRAVDMMIGLIGERDEKEKFGELLGKYRNGLIAQIGGPDSVSAATILAHHGQENGTLDGVHVVGQDIMHARDSSNPSRWDMATVYAQDDLYLLMHEEKFMILRRIVHIPSTLINTTPDPDRFSYYEMTTEDVRQQRSITHSTFVEDLSELVEKAHQKGGFPEAPLHELAVIVMQAMRPCIPADRMATVAGLAAKNGALVPAG